MKQPHVLYKAVISALLIVLGNLHLPVNAAEPVLSFDGNDYVMMDAGLYQGLSSLTLSAWVRTDTIPSDYAAIAGQGYLGNTIGFGFFTLSSGEVSFQTRYVASIVTATAAFYFDNTWHHLAGVRDSATDDTILYIDGVEVARGHGALTSLDANMNFALGSRYISELWKFYFCGAISEVRLWDYARSQGEIQADMTTRLNGDESGLLAYWPLDEGEGATAYDNTANGSDGDIINASWVVGESLYLENFFVRHPFTGSTRFTNTNKLDVTRFPGLPGYNEYQITEGGALPVDEAWISTNTLPDTVEFTAPGSDAEIILTAWLTNSPPASVEVLRFEARMLFTTTLPVPAVKATHSRGKAPSQAVIVYPWEIDDGSTGGTTGGEEIPVHSLHLRVESGPGADATPEEPFITVSATGTYQVTLTVTNAAGNAETSTTCDLTVEEIASNTFVWEGSVDNDWFNPLNWDLMAVPFDGTEVIIQESADVVLNAPTAELASFEMTGGTLMLTNWTAKLSAVDVDIEGGTLTTPYPDFSCALSNRVHIVCTDFFLAENATINVNERGYGGAWPGSGVGPGANGYGAPGHGGRGADFNVASVSIRLGGDTYGDPAAPVGPGSSGGCSDGRVDREGGHGGGSVRIDAAGHVAVNGVITANGGSNGWQASSSPGAGGAVWITCSTFAGSNGLVSADGVDGNGIAPGSGGGRIAVIYDPVAQDAMPVPDVTFSAYGGTSYHETLQSNDGDIGTVYFPDARWFGGAYMPQVTGQLLFGAVPSEISFDSLVLSNAWVRFPRDVYRIVVSNDLFITGEKGRLDVGSGGYFTGWGYWRLDNTSGEKNFWRSAVL